MDKKNSGNILQKLYNYRFRIDRNGKTIVNLSSLFSLACLLLAPHMTIAGVIISLLLGYHIEFVNEADDTDIEDRILQAADTVKKTASAAVRTIRDEVGRAAASRAGEKQPAEKKSAGEIPVAEPAPDFSEKAEELVDDLMQHTYQSAYAASAGSVPVLEVHEEETAEAPSGKKYMER